MIRRRDLLAAAAALPLGASAAAPASRRLVVVVCSGGWDATYCVDPKPGIEGIDDPSIDSDPADPLDIEEVESFSGIPIAFNNGRRPSVSAFFERWAARTTVVNGVWMGAVSHVANMRRVLTGTALEGQPDFATIASTVLAPELAIGNLDLVGMSLPGPFSSRLVRIGANGQLRTVLGTDAAYGPLAFAPDPAQSAAVSDYRTARLDRLRSARGGTLSAAKLDSLADAMARRPGLDAMATSLDLAALAGPSDGFDFQVALTTDLFRRDLCRVVTLASPEGWDTHTNNTVQSDNLEVLFAGLLAFTDTLESEGMLDSTTIAVVSEMTRSPRQNAEGGKDHWPVASALLCGGGVAGGRVVGATDNGMEPKAVNGAVPDYGNMMAGFLELVGIDSEPWLPGVAPLEFG